MPCHKWDTSKTTLICHSTSVFITSVCKTTTLFLWFRCDMPCHKCVMPCSAVPYSRKPASHHIFPAPPLMTCGSPCVQDCAKPRGAARVGSMCALQGKSALEGGKACLRVSWRGSRVRLIPIRLVLTSSGDERARAKRRKKCEEEGKHLLWGEVRRWHACTRQDMRHISQNLSRGQTNNLGESKPSWF